MHKIAGEKHLVTGALTSYGALTAGIAQPGVWAEQPRRLAGLTGERLVEMDQSGVDTAVP